GEDKWIRVSWEEALDLIASELKRIYSVVIIIL
ncbi:molybdopterin-dependent oxidoreductase, partial [Parasutterella excrementihominis]|nr:molybdopterin-dependent oxidoreductase [Parasutterella excrementihominis]